MPDDIVERHIACPVCPSSDAYCLYADGHGHCFSCNYHFSPKKDFLLPEAFTYEYLPHREISKNTLAKYDVKTKIDREGKPVETGFRYPNGAYKIRNFDKKDFRTSGEIGKAGLFGRDKFSAGSHRYVTITEGEYDALTLYQVIGSPVVSVQSSSSAVRDCTCDREWLASFERVYLAFDSDAPGRDAARAVARLFDYRKVYQLKFSRFKDANEYAQNNEWDELRNIWHNAQKFLPEHVVSSFSDFEVILKEPLKESVPYPFPTLTEMTYGIRRGESVLITAQEGVGKTELMHAIEHKLLKETDDGIGAIYLEEPKRRHLQSLAGLELQRPAHLPDSGCSDDQVLAAIKEVVRVDDRLHIYSHFGSDDPEVLLDTIRFLVSARGVVYVLLDHISMAVSGLAGEDERRALDYISTRLEMMVKELNFALIFVSHVNDFGQTRGSRYISKIADIRIDVERDLLAEDPTVRNTTKLRVSKNRFCGKTGPAGELIFDPVTNTYSEKMPVPANDNEEGANALARIFKSIGAAA